MTNDKLDAYVLSVLTTVAREGRQCPANREIALAVGSTELRIEYSIKRLKDAGKVSARASGGKRVINIIGAGLATAPCTKETELSQDHMPKETFIGAFERFCGNMVARGYRFEDVRMKPARRIYVSSSTEYTAGVSQYGR